MGTCRSWTSSQKLMERPGGTPLGPRAGRDRRSALPTFRRGGFIGDEAASPCPVLLVSSEDPGEVRDTSSISVTTDSRSRLLQALSVSVDAVDW
jgi:hypothetical protein